MSTEDESGGTGEGPAENSRSPNAPSNRSSERFEELRELQRVIERHEEHAFRVKGWFAAIIGLLAAAVYSQHVDISKAEFTFLAIVIFVMMTHWLLYHRLITRRAISRVEDIEKQKTPYDGSKIVETLSAPITARQLFNRRLDPQIHVPLLLGAVIVASLVGFVWTNPNLPLWPFSPPPNHSEPNAPARCAPTPNLPPACAPVAAQPSGFDSTFAISLVLLGLGAALLLRHDRAAKAAGAALLTLGSLHVFLAKEFKIEVDKFLAIKFAGSTPPPAPAPIEHFGAEHLGVINGFRVGAATIDDSGLEQPEAATEALAAICKHWGVRTDADHAMILIVGATDRLPLGSASHARFEANTGLALARAAAVEEYLTRNCWHSPHAPDPDNVVLLASGPHTTPLTATPTGTSTDRRVDVWVLANSRTPAAPAGGSAPERTPNAPVRQ